MPVETLDDAKALIETWVNDRGFPISTIPVSDKFNFQFGGISSLGIGFAIIQPKDLKRAIAVVTRIEFDPVHIKVLESLDQNDRDEFLWNLKKDLLFNPPAFFFSDPNHPKFIEFLMHVSFDEITEGRLQNAMDQTVRSVLFVAWSLSRRFGVPKGEEK